MSDAKVDIKVVMEKSFKDKIDWLVQNVGGEIGAFITGDILEEEIILKDLLIPEQETTGASVDFSPEQLVKLRKEYGDACLKIIGEFHSHNTMKAFWSSVDEGFIEQYSKNKEVSVWIVSSKDDGHLIRVEIRKPFKISVDELEYSVKNDELDNILIEELTKKLKKPTNTYKEIYNTEKQKTLTYSGLKHYKKIASGKIRYLHNENKVKVVELSPFIAQLLDKEFLHLKAEINSYGEEFNLVFSFKNNKEAKNFLKELNPILVEMLQKEDENSVIANSEELNDGIPSYEDYINNREMYGW